MKEMDDNIKCFLFLLFTPRFLCNFFLIAVCLRVCYIEQWPCGNENLKLWETGEWSFVPQFQVPHSVFIQFRDPKMLHSWFFSYQASWATNGLDKVHSCCGHVVSRVYLCRASARQAHFTWQKWGINWSLVFNLLRLYSNFPMQELFVSVLN